MASLVQLFNEWEIQMLVLLSFMLQVFLFFAGGLRRCTHRGSLMFLIWIAYLGADLVAAYTLGVISRQEYGGSGDAGTHHQLAILWAPFLLIHLGGQDTITGFSLEDNNLWRRHLLNLAVQATLTLYIFCKSANGTNTKLLATSILVFITGTIKYGERTWALWCGVLKALKESRVPESVSAKVRLPSPSLIGGEYEDQERRPRRIGNELREQLNRDEASVLSAALVCLRTVVTFLWEDDSFGIPLPGIWDGHLLPNKVSKILEIELSLVYDYIYTKAMVFQTKGGFILRCISQASFVASFLLFATTVARSKHYSSIDTATTYALFVGELSLEACALFATVSSPWAWVWLQRRRRHCSSSSFLFLASIIARWHSKRVLWSCSMGQYNLRDYLAKYDHRKSRTSWKRRVVARIRNVVDKTCGLELRFWISKHLDIKFVEVDEGIMQCIFEMVAQYAEEGPQQQQHWPNLGAVLAELLIASDPEGSMLGWECIAWLHTYTEAQLRMYRLGPGDVEGESTCVMVQKLSNYMPYLLATQPGMLPVSIGAHSRGGGIAGYFAEAAKKMGNNTDDGDDFWPSLFPQLEVRPPSDCTKEQLLETREAWIRLLIYMAGRSRPEMHAAQLARGGELLTFVWLFMAFKRLGGAVGNPVDISDTTREIRSSRNKAPLIRLPPLPEQETDSGSPAQLVEEGRQ